MALSRSSRSGRFLRGSSLVVCSSSFQSRVCRRTKEGDTSSVCAPRPAMGSPFLHLPMDTPTGFQVNTINKQMEPPGRCTEPSLAPTKGGGRRCPGRAGPGCRHLSRNVLLIAQPRGVGILCTHTVHGMLCLRGRPAVHLERGGNPLEWVALDPVAGRGGERG